MFSDKVSEESSLTKSLSFIKGGNVNGGIIQLLINLLIKIL